MVQPDNTHGYGAQPSHPTSGIPPQQYSPAAPPYPPQQAYPQAYPPQQAYPQAYPTQPGYQPMPMVAAPVGLGTPGGVTAAAVLSYIQGGLLLIGAIAILAVGSIAGEAGLGQLQTIISLFGVGDLVLLALFIIAGVFVQTGRGRVLLFVAAGLNTAAGIFWIYAYIKGDASLIWVPLLYIAMPIIGVITASVGGVAQWEAARRAQRGMIAPPPQY